MFGPYNSSARVVRYLIAVTAALLAVLPLQGAAAQSLASQGQTANQVQVGAGLDAITATATGDRRTMITALRALPTIAERADALGQISPQSYTLLPQLAIQSMNANEMLLRNYLAERRSIDADAPAGVPQSGDRSVHMTLMGDVRQAKYKAGVDRPRANSDSRSIAFAIDVAPKPGLVLGVSLGIDGLDAQLDPRRPRITQFNSHIGPYASYNNGRMYLDATAAYNLADYSLRREVQFTGFIDRLTAHPQGDNWSASAESGLLLKIKKTRLQPFIGVHYRYADVSAFHENGGTAALNVARYKAESVQLAIGARVSTTIEKGAWAIRPTATAEWRRELKKQPSSQIESRLVSLDVGTWSLQPSRLKRDTASVSAGITATYNSRTSFRVGYIGEFASDRHVNGATISVSRRF